MPVFNADAFTYDQVTMNEAMSLFKKFLNEFKIKYRRKYDSDRGLPAPPNAVLRNEDPEQELYKH